MKVGSQRFVLCFIRGFTLQTNLMLGSCHVIGCLGVCCVFGAVYCSRYFCSTKSLEALIPAWGLLSGLCSSKTFPKLPIPPKHLEGGFPFGSIRTGQLAKTEIFLCCCYFSFHCLWCNLQYSNSGFRVPYLWMFTCVDSNVPGFLFNSCRARKFDSWSTKIAHRQTVLFYIVLFAQFNYHLSIIHNSYPNKCYSFTILALCHVCGSSVLMIVSVGIGQENHCD